MLDTSEFIIQVLIENQKLSQDDAKRLREYILDKEMSFDEAVIRSNIISPTEVAIAKATICEYPFTDLNNYDIDIRQSRCMPKSMAERLPALYFRRYRNGSDGGPARSTGDRRAASNTQKADRSCCL